MWQNMGLSDNLVVMASVIMSDVYSSNPMSPLPQILSMQPHNFLTPKTHNLFSYLFHSFNPKLWHARGAADSSCTSGEIHVIVGPMFDGKTTTLLRRIESESSNGRFVNLHQFYFLCVLYTCLKFMWVVDKILARFGGWCFFFLARFMWLVLFVSTVKHEIFQVQCRIGQFNYLYGNVPFLNLCIVIDLELAFT